MRYIKIVFVFKMIETKESGQKEDSVLVQDESNHSMIETTVEMPGNSTRVTSRPSPSNCDHTRYSQACNISEKLYLQ